VNKPEGQDPKWVTDVVVGIREAPSEGRGCRRTRSSWMGTGHGLKAKGSSLFLDDGSRGEHAGCIDWTGLSDYKCSIMEV